MSVSIPPSGRLYPNNLSALCSQEWLSRFGYLPPADPATGQLQTQEELSKAITAMQQFGGLETTGILGQFSGRHQKAPWFHQGCASLVIHSWLPRVLKLATEALDWLEAET